jgi:hypothetical protein
LSTLKKKLPVSKSKTKPKAGAKKPKPPVSKIGTMKESSLHRKLKFSYAGRGGQTEVAAGEYIADGRRKDGEYIEIQTGSFAPLAGKVKELAAAGSVRIIHPIGVSKVIEVYEPGNPYGAMLYRRKSPLKGTQWNIFDALLHAPLLPLTPGLKIEIVFVDILEKRIKDGKGSWRRKGVSLHDKELATLHESILLEKPADYLRFVPFKKKEEFTSASFAKSTGISTDTARKVLYVLTKMKVVKRMGKTGNSWVYVRM